MENGLPGCWLMVIILKRCKLPLHFSRKAFFREKFSLRQLSVSFFATVLCLLNLGNQACGRDEKESSLLACASSFPKASYDP